MTPRTRKRSAPARTKPAIPLAIAAAIALTSCQQQTRVVSVSGGLYGLPGAESGIDNEATVVKASSGTGMQAVLDQYHGGRTQLLQGEEVEDRPNRRELEDGSLLLVSRSPRDLIIHLFETAIDSEWELMYEQLLAEETKDDYRQAERDPTDAIRFIRKHRTDFVTLLRELPAGENTPGVDFITLGSNMYRLHVPSLRQFGARFHTLDFSIEAGRYVMLAVR